MPRLRRAPDRYDYYEQAVQSPDLQARFLRALHAAPAAAPLTLGEDFCGSGALTEAWLSIDPAHRAACIDHDPEPLERLRERLSDDQAARARIEQGDALDWDAPGDVIATLNFSICELRDRRSMSGYFRRARRRLRPGGSLVIDIYAGAEEFTLGESDMEMRGGVRYVWEQREADPVTGRVVNAIHFFPPGDEPIRDAFVYRWRLWSPPELRDAMLEAGFTRVDIYERFGQAVDTEGVLYPAPVDHPSELDETFVVYLVARTDQAPGGEAEGGA